MTILNNIQKKRLSVYIIFAIIAWIVSMIPIDILPIHGFGGIIYISILIGWTLSLHRRIVHPVIRRLLVTSAIFMASLFYLRICRYDFFILFPYIRQYFWYLYYVPFTGVPLFAFFAALAVDTPEDVMKMLKWESKSSVRLSLISIVTLIVVWIILCIAIMTNAIHGQMFHIKDAVYEEYSYGIIYIVVVIWEIVFSIAAFSVMMRKCSISSMHHYWMIPVVPSVIAAVLMILYIIVGGSPAIFGIRLYKIQEAFCLLYVGLFEGSIAIGLIPSNSGYEELFELSHINAAIVNSEGVLVYKSHNYTENNELSNDIYIRHRENDISGGRILWTEDLQGIAKINENIRIATEQIEEENDLIEQENRIAAERALYEAKNRLYDKIAAIVRPQVEKIDEELRCDDSHFYNNLKHSVVIASYIKRRGNLILIADGNSLVSTDELAFAIRESLEYLELSDIYTKLDVTGEGKISSEIIMYAYDMFEEIVENIYKELLTVFVKIDARQVFIMQISVALKNNECPVIDNAWRRDELEAIGADIVVDYIDDTWHITMYTGEEDY